jgi:hypothetical protein
MPKDNDVSAKELDADAMSAIRSMLADEPPSEPLVKRGRAVPEPAVAQAPSRKVLPEIEPQGELPQEQAPPQKRVRKKAKPAKVKPDLSHLGFVDQIKFKITSFRPSGRQIAIAAAVLFVFFKPWLVIGLIALSIFITIGIFLVVGYDGFWRGVMGGARWYANRRPDRADAMHRRLDNFAMKWDGFLDRFPEGSVDGLYLPDLGQLEAAEELHQEALDRRFEGLRKS